MSRAWITEWLRRWCLPYVCCSYNITRMIVIALMALMYGSIYWQQGALITGEASQLQPAEASAIIVKLFLIRAMESESLYH
eukprot:scaffold291894_cov50-Prasinocladus_malaysianus.AAC.1